MQLVEHQLGAEALEYVRWCLGHGRTLSQLLDKRLSDSPGSVTTLLPPAVRSSDLLDFRGGEKLPPRPKSEHREGRGSVLVPIPTSKREWASRIRGYLDGGPDRVCLFENWIVRRDDPVAADLEGPLLFYGREIYHLVGSGSDDERIVTSMDDAFSQPICVATLTESRSDELPDPKDGAALELAHLEFLAARSVAIIVGAYDGEGYVMWRAEDGSR